MYGKCPFCKNEYVKFGSFVNHVMRDHEYTREEAEEIVKEAAESMEA